MPCAWRSSTRRSSTNPGPPSSSEKARPVTSCGAGKHRPSCARSCRQPQDGKGETPLGVSPSCPCPGHPIHTMRELNPAELARFHGQGRCSGVHRLPGEGLRRLAQLPVAGGPSPGGAHGREGPDRRAQGRAPQRGLARAHPDGRDSGGHPLAPLAAGRLQEDASQRRTQCNAPYAQPRSQSQRNNRLASPPTTTIIASSTPTSLMCADHASPNHIPRNRLTA